MTTTPAAGAGRYALADVAALIGEPTRAAMLLGLLDSRARTATELARIADLSAPATSLHLGKLARAGLVVARRTCYDHLAGVLAIDLARALERGKVVALDRDDGYRVTRAGARWFDAALAIDVAALGDARRPISRRCIDWTERRPHLAGALGAAVLDRFLERRWVARTPESRALRITPHGAAAVAKLTRALDVPR